MRMLIVNCYNGEDEEVLAIAQLTEEFRKVVEDAVRYAASSPSEKCPDYMRWAIDQDLVAFSHGSEDIETQEALEDVHLPGVFDQSSLPVLEDLLEEVEMGPMEIYPVYVEVDTDDLSVRIIGEAGDDDETDVGSGGIDPGIIIGREVFDEILASRAARK